MRERLPNLYSCPDCGSVEPEFWVTLGTSGWPQPRCARGHRRRKMESLAFTAAIERLRVKTLEEVDNA